MNLQERIARVLCKADGYDPEQVRFPDGDMVLGGPFYGTARHHFPDDIGKARWQSPIYQKSASYVIAEFERTTDAMEEAGRQAEINNYDGPDYSFHTIWHAMIDAGKAEY